ncbi:MAG: hypothetical protein IANPNBLG_03804 [Bryobacteraceae bacterium]|nr:hypothetical protein [Bryobacteraceae bacterium]
MLIRLSPITSSPTLHSLLPFVEAAVQPMPPLQSADVSLATCAPLLALLNQSFFCIFLRSSLLVERFGTDPFFTPFSATAFSPLAE